MTKIIPLMISLGSFHLLLFFNNKKDLHAIVPSYQVVLLCNELSVNTSLQAFHWLAFKRQSQVG